MGEKRKMRKKFFFTKLQCRQMWGLKVEEKKPFRKKGSLFGEDRSGSFSPQSSLQNLDCWVRSVFQDRNTLACSSQACNFLFKRYFPSILLQPMIVGSSKNHLFFFLPCLFFFCSNSFSLARQKWRQTRKNYQNKENVSFLGWKSTRNIGALGFLSVNTQGRGDVGASRRRFVVKEKWTGLNCAKMAWSRISFVRKRKEEIKKKENLRKQTKRR